MYIQGEKRSVKVRNDMDSRLNQISKLMNIIRRSGTCKTHENTPDKLANCGITSEISMFLEKAKEQETYYKLPTTCPGQ